MTKKDPETFGTKPIVTETETQKVEQYDYCFNLVVTSKGVKIAVGQKIVCPTTFESLEAAKSFIDSKPWSLMVAVFHTTNEIINKATAK